MKQIDINCTQILAEGHLVSELVNAILQCTTLKGEAISVAIHEPENTTASLEKDVEQYKRWWLDSTGQVEKIREELKLMKAAYES